MRSRKFSKKSSRKARRSKKLSRRKYRSTQQTNEWVDKILYDAHVFGNKKWYITEEPKQYIFFPTPSDYKMLLRKKGKRYIDDLLDDEYKLPMYITFDNEKEANKVAEITGSIEELRQFIPPFFRDVIRDYEKRYEEQTSDSIRKLPFAQPK